MMLQLYPAEQMAAEPSNLGDDMHAAPVLHARIIIR